VVANGQKGADIVHKVMDDQGLVGTILYEVKNTKAFSEGWIQKLREDQRAKGAEIAVLMSSVLPREIGTFASRGGVWVTSCAACLPLAMALRWGLLEAARIRVVAENQAGKQADLLTYCGGTEFRQRIEAILDPVLALVEDLDKERQATETLWSRRRKRHEQIARGIAGLYGDVSAILGTLPRIQRLRRHRTSWRSLRGHVPRDFAGGAFRLPSVPDCTYSTVGVLPECATRESRIIFRQTLSLIVTYAIRLDIPTQFSRGPPSRAGGRPQFRCHDGTGRE
jgi:hypothetical protein